MHQVELDLRALEWRIRDLDERVAAVEDGARGLLEANRAQQVLAAIADLSPGACDSAVATLVTGCAGLPVPGAYVAAISPVDGRTIMDGTTAADGTIELCGLASEGGILVDVDAAGYAPTATSISLPRAVGAAAVGIALGALVGYPSPPPVTFDAPAGGGRRAQGYARLAGSGLVQDVVITDPGSGYTPGSPPAVTFGDDGTGSGGRAAGYAVLGGAGLARRAATATVTMDANGQVASFTITDGGDGYRKPPPCTITTGPTTNPFRVPTCRATLGGLAVAGLVAVDPGANVRPGATLAVAIGVPSPSANPSDGVEAVVITDPGRTYACVGNCGFAPLDGVLTDPGGAVGRIGLVPGVNDLVLFDSGVVVEDADLFGGYGCQPGAMATRTAKFPIWYQVNLLGTAAAHANRVGGQVTSCTLDFAGHGYFSGSPPSVVIAPPGGASPVQALAHATVDVTTGALTGIVMDNVGNGYTVTPAVTIGPTPRPEPYLSARANPCKPTGGGPGVGMRPGFYANPLFTPGGTNASVRPTSITCAPYSASYTFAGTSFDGTVFQGGLTCTITGP